jgi:hypothetical protein
MDKELRPTIGLQNAGLSLGNINFCFAIVLLLSRRRASHQIIFILNVKIKINNSHRRTDHRISTSPSRERWL